MIPIRSASAALVLAALLAAPPTAGGARQTTPVRDAFLAYAGGAHDVTAALGRLGSRSILRELGDAADEWLEQTVPAASGKVPGQRNLFLQARERANWRVAAFALESFYATAIERRSEENRASDLIGLIEFGRKRLRPMVPIRAFYEHWYHALVAALEVVQFGSELEKRSEESLKYLASLEAMQAALAARSKDAGSPFRLRPRFLLARGVAAEILTSPYGGSDGTVSRRSLDEGTRRFTVAMAHADVHAEAALRLGFLELRAGEVDRALVHLDDAVVRADEPALAYLARLFRGRALMSASRPAEAAEAFQAALEIVPGAQSATLGLAGVRFQAHDVDESSRLADGLFARPSLGIDPWWHYWMGDGRRWASIIGALREDLR